MRSMCAAFPRRSSAVACGLWRSRVVVCGRVQSVVCGRVRSCVVSCGREQILLILRHNLLSPEIIRVRKEKMIISHMTSGAHRVLTSYTLSCRSSLETNGPSTSSSPGGEPRDAYSARQLHRTSEIWLALHTRDEEGVTPINTRRQNNRRQGQVEQSAAGTLP